MHPIYFYKDKRGRSQVKEYFADLAKKNDKDSRIKMNKILGYTKALQKYGTVIGEPYIKHISGEIWELRPLRDRIFFVAWIDGSFVLLHQFLKKSQKTPTKEIEKAKKEFADLKERSDSYEF